MGFNISSLPFTYLAAPIFKGRLKVAYFQPIADKVRNKMSAWKASLLSMAGRIQLIKSVITSMLIWSGDIAKWKMMTVAWKSVCADLKL
jgi:hypothetical protein